MLFSTHEYIFLFLPLSLPVFYTLKSPASAKYWLLLASLLFYGWWNPAFVPLLLASILFNYAIGRMLLNKPSRYLLAAGVGANIVLLGYFKYAQLMLDALNTLLGTDYALNGILLPLGISFFTFTQISFLVDAYRGKVENRRFVDYALFVTFFPHLILGPIIHHRAMMPQFAAIAKERIRFEPVARGIFLFAIGLFKKVVFADSFAALVDSGYANTANLSLPEAWVTIIAFYFQLYFDFSGYTDMALGSSLMFNIRLPENFNSPYQSLNMIHFWKRWNITLGRFIFDYLYTPLCRNHSSKLYRAVAVLFCFTLMGLWHGASVNFILFGLAAGILVLIVRGWHLTGIKLPRATAWSLCTLSILLLEMLFRARSIDQIWNMLAGLFGTHAVSDYALPHLPIIPDLVTASVLWLMPLAALVIAWPHNSTRLSGELDGTRRYQLMTGFLILASLLKMSGAHAFIYFDF